MISFKLGKVVTKNATVRLGLIESKDNDHDAFVERDPEGNLEITVDMTLPENGTPVTFINHKEGDRTYSGKLAVKKDGAKDVILLIPNA